MKVRRLTEDRALAVVVAIGAALRLISAVAFARVPAGVHDPLMYHTAAVHISNGKGYSNFWGDPTAYYPPGYPWFLGVQQSVLKVIGAEGMLYRTAPILQAIIGGFAVWAIVGAARRLDADPERGRRIGLCAGAIFALWPNLVLHSAALLSESLFLGALSAVLYGWSRLFAQEFVPLSARWWRMAALAGVGLGIATLTRPQVLLFLVALAVGAAVLRCSWRDRIAIFMAPAVIGAGVVLPWTVRNYVVFDEFVAVSTNGGDNLCIGFNRDAIGHWFAPEQCDTGEFYLDGPEAEVRRNHEASAIAQEWIRANLSRLPWLSWRKLVYTYDNDVDGLRAIEGYGSDEFLPDAVRTWFRWSSNLYYLVAMAAAVAGLTVLIARTLRGWRLDDHERGWPMAVVLGGVSSAMVPILFFGEARFKVPSTPFFAVFGAVALATLWDRLRSSEHVTSSAS